MNFLSEHVFWLQWLVLSEIGLLCFVGVAMCRFGFRDGLGAARSARSATFLAVQSTAVFILLLLLWIAETYR